MKALFRFIDRILHISGKLLSSCHKILRLNIFAEPDVPTLTSTATSDAIQLDWQPLDGFAEGIGIEVVVDGSVIRSVRSILPTLCLAGCLF